MWDASFTQAGTGMRRKVEERRCDGLMTAASGLFRLLSLLHILMSFTMLDFV